METVKLVQEGQFTWVVTNAIAGGHTSAHMHRQIHVTCTNYGWHTYYFSRSSFVIIAFTIPVVFINFI